MSISLGLSPGIGRRIFIGCLLCTVALLGAFGLLAYHRSPTRSLPYHDSFAQGKAEEWKAFGGTWELVKGSMRNDSDERGAKLLTGSTRWRNYSIEADVMLLGLGGDAGLLVRSSDEEQGVDAYNGYYAGIRTVDNSLVLGRADHGWMEVNFPLRPPLLRAQVSQWYHLKLLGFGCRLVASVGLPSQPNPTTASILDEDCIRSGRVGLRSYSSGGVWRNVVVKPAAQNDLDQMLHQVQPPQATTVPPPVTDTQILRGSHVPPPDNRPQALPSSPDSQPISSLRLDPSARPARATVRGIVTLTSPALFVQDSTGGISVRPSEPRPLKVGDEVEVTGDARPDAFSSTLENASVRVLWEGTPMPAVSVTASQAATGAFDANFIEVEGRLRSKQYGPEDTLVFDFDSGPQSFRAIMNRGRGDYLYGGLKPNSLLRLRGISVVNQAYTHDLTPFAVLVRSTDDIDVLAGPPWWSAGHLVAIAISFLLLALLGNFLYHRVEHWRLRAVLEERERLAFEMHDTLAQSFAGIGFQLEAIRNGMPRELPKIHQQLDLASELVRHSHVEARRSIDMLRPEQLASKGLLSALDNCARRLVEAGSVLVVASSSGDARPLPLRTTDTLYRIGQEALANSVRHARPGTITIKLDYKRNLVCLAISDDGCGFDPEDGLRGFGVLGMHKRAASIAAQLLIRSDGNGTQVAVTALLPPPVSLTSWPAILRKTFREHTRNVATASKSHPHSYR